MSMSLSPRPERLRMTRSLDLNCGRRSMRPAMACADSSAGIIPSVRESSFAASSAAELTTIYNAYNNATTYAADYHDITTGFCSFYDGNLAVVKWDLCTGVGSPKTYVGK